MADNDMDTTDDLSDGLDDEKEGFGARKIILFIILPLLLIGGGGAAAYFSGLMDGMLNKAPNCEEVTDPADPLYEECQVGLLTGSFDQDDRAPGQYYSIPSIRVNLNNTGGKQKFLFLSIQIEVPDQRNLTAIESYAPRIIDHFQTYLREVRLEDLQGSPGIYRLRRELLERIKAAAPDLEVRDVLFQEILVQ